MDSVMYTWSVPIIFGILFGYMKYFDNLYVANTQLIIRQNDQIMFLLKRVIEIENKIKNIKILMSNINVNESSVLHPIKEGNEDISDDDVNIDADDENDLDIVSPVLTNKNVSPMNTDKNKDKEFELVETTMELTTVHKNKNWLRNYFSF